MGGTKSGLVIILLLWSTVIGEDAEWPKTEEPPPISGQTPAPTFTPKGQGKKASLPAMPVRGGSEINSAAFLAAFQRQATLDLLPCLKAWRPSPSSLGMSALLDRSGQLSHAAPLDPSEALPGCASSALTDMRFPAQAQELKHESITVQWRIDW